MLGQVLVDALLRHAVERAVARFQRAVEHAVAEVDRVLVLEPLEEMADRGARLARDHELQPLRPGRRRRRGDDLDRLAADQLAAQRHQLLVDAGGDRVVADVGVHRVGVVERGGVARQREDVALGREQVDLVREQVDLDVLQELQRRAGRLLAVHQAAHPVLGARLGAVHGRGRRSCTASAPRCRARRSRPSPRCGSAPRSGVP